MKFHLFLLGALTLTVLTSGCESEERKDIFAAQVCIDNLDIPKGLKDDTDGDAAVQARLTALRSSVDECIQPINGYTSQEALTLKCASGFLSGGIEEQAIIETFSALEKEKEEDGSPANDPTPRVMEILSFGSTPGDKTLAQDTLNNCKRSQSKSLVALAGLVNIATIFENVAGDGEIAQLIDGFQPDDMDLQEKIDMANTVIDSQEELCDPDSGLMKKEDFCKDLNQAIEDNGGADGLSEAEKQILINDFITELDED